MHFLRAWLKICNFGDGNHLWERCWQVLKMPKNYWTPQNSDGLSETKGTATQESGEHKFYSEHCTLWQKNNETRQRICL